MAISFDGVTKIITLSAGTTELDVVDLYSRWKNWVQGGNANFLEAFAPVGGNPIDAANGTSVPLYAFLTNGWRVRPQSANHTLNVVGGVLLVAGGGDPFVDPVGSYVVRVNYQQPVQAITVATGGAAAGLTPEQATKLLEVWKRLGLDGSAPLVNTDTEISAGSLVLNITKTDTSTTVARQ